VLLSLGLAALLAGLYFKWRSRGRAPAHVPLGAVEALSLPVRASEPAAEPEWRPWPDASDRAKPAIARADALPQAAPAPALVPPMPLAPPPAPVPAAPSNEDRVIAALRDLLTFGLTVPTIPDEGRRRKKSRPDAA